MNENITKKRSKPLQKNLKLDENSVEGIENKVVAPNSGLTQIFTREIRYLKTKDIKRAMSKLIIEFCKGTIMNEDARTLNYLLSSYIQILTAVDLEERIKKLENQNG